MKCFVFWKSPLPHFLPLSPLFSSTPRVFFAVINNSFFQFFFLCEGLLLLIFARSAPFCQLGFPLYFFCGSGHPKLKSFLVRRFWRFFWSISHVPQSIFFLHLFLAAVDSFARVLGRFSGVVYPASRVTASPHRPPPSIPTLFFLIHAEQPLSPSVFDFRCAVSNTPPYSCMGLLGPGDHGPPGSASC